MQLFSILILMVFAYPSFSVGAEPSADAAMERFLSGYIGLQEALSNDDLGASQQKVRELLKSLDGSQGGEFQKIVSHLKKMDKSSKIAEVRKEFKGVSSLVIDWLKKHPKPDLEIMYCPMAGARWIQKKGGEPINPYMGREMLHCGEKAS